LQEQRFIAILIIGCCYFRCRRKLRCLLNEYIWFI